MSLTVVYNQEEPPVFFKKSLYLAGTNIAEKTVKLEDGTYKDYTWRDEVIDIISQLPDNDETVIFCPQDNPNGESPKFPDCRNTEEYAKQIEWENTWMNAADAILFWLPRNIDNLGLISNIELGRYIYSGRVFIGAPWVNGNLDKNEYLRCLCEKFGDTLKENVSINWYTDLHNMVEDALEYLGKGSTRQKEERKVPLQIWEDKTFAGWKKDIENNDLHCKIKDYKVLYTKCEPISKNLFLWIIRPDIRVTGERRNKDCELVIGRSAGCSICVYTKDTKLEDTKILLIQEFRSACRAKEGYVLELPGGAYHDGESIINSALDELREEAGVEITDKEKQAGEFLGNRQNMPTLIANKTYIYKIPITSERMSEIARNSKGKKFGIKEETEITYVKIETFKNLMKNTHLDWSTLGIITSAIIGSKYK